MRNTTKGTSDVVKVIIEGLVSDGEAIYGSKLHEMIVHLDEIFKNSPEFNLSSPSLINEGVVLNDSEDGSPMTKKRKVINGLTEKPEFVIASNSRIVSMINVIKKEVTACLELMSVLKVWIELNIPSAETGNNHGVDVQEQAIAVISQFEKSVMSVLENVTMYFNARAKLLSKVIKYPQIEDYKVCVHEFDEKKYVNLRLGLKDMRDGYCTIYDMLNKNIDKLKKPRQAGHLSGMY